MNRLLSLVLLLTLGLTAKAQKVVRFVDAETELPVANVLVADKDSIFAKANTDGVVFIPRMEGSVIFVHEAYDRLEMPYDELSQIVIMTRRTQQIDEVVVVGKGEERVDKHAVDVRIGKTDAQLIAAGRGSGNLLSPLKKLFTSRKKRRLERTKKALENFDHQ